jgi:hypothetical protein
LQALVAQRDEIVSLAVEAESGSYDAEVGARRLMSTKCSLERVLDKNASAIDGNNAAPAPSLLSAVTSKLDSLMTPTPTTAATAAQSAAASPASLKAHDLAALMATDRLSHLHVAYDELQFYALLSKGVFADVHVGRFHEERVAIKMLNRPMVTADVGLFHREVQIMSRLRSDRLVQLCAVCVEQGRVCLVVQYTTHGSLSQVLIASVYSRVVICFCVARELAYTFNFLCYPLTQSQYLTSRCAAGQALSFGEKYRLAMDIALGVLYLHNHGILHRNLSASNVYVSHGRAKIGDFGAARSSSLVRSATPSHA